MASQTPEAKKTSIRFKLLTFLWYVWDALVFALCVSVFGPSTWLWVILINVCARLKGRPGAARDLEAQTKKQALSLNPLQWAAESIKSTSWYTYVFTWEYLKHTAITICVLVSILAIPFLFAKGLFMRAKVESFIGEFQQDKYVESVIILNVLWLYCLDRCSGSHLFSLLHTTKDKSGVDGKKDRATLPGPVLEKVVGGLADAAEQYTEAKEALGKMKKFLPVMLINQGSAVAE